MNPLQEDSLKPIVEPILYREKAIWKSFVAQLFEENPEYWGKYSLSRRIKNFWIYKKEGTKVIEVINFDKWRSFMNKYFQGAKDAIIQGRVFNLGSALGIIYAKRIERNWANKQIDYYATSQVPKVLGSDGKLRPERIVYHMEPWYCRIGWDKCKRIPNESVYKFEIANGNSSGKGFKREFITAMRADPLLPFKYRYFAWRINNENFKPVSNAV